MENGDRVLITGVNGFIGGYLAEELLKLGYRVYGITQEDKCKVKGVKALKGDLMDFDRIGEILEQVQPNYLIHLAARTEVEKSFYEQVSFSAINYVGTVNLIEKCRPLIGNSLKLFIFSSTMETYGWQPKDNWRPFDEDTEQNPNAPYAVAKVGCEFYLKYAGRVYGLPWTAFRQTNTYGRWDNDYFVVEQFITQMLRNPNKVEFGYAEPYRNFLHISDLIELYKTVLAQPQNAKNEIFCCGPDNAIKIKTLADNIAQKLDWHGEIVWDRKLERPGEIFYLNSTADKASRFLGWEPKIDLDKGLDMAIEIWRKNISEEKANEAILDKKKAGLAKAREVAKQNREAKKANEQTDEKS